MTSIRVRAEQTTVDWERGSEFDVERTTFVDRLIADGGLVVIGEAPTADADIAADASHTFPEWERRDEPPYAGKGSGLPQWRDFLDARGVEYSADASRDDLIAVWNEHVAAARSTQAQADLGSARHDASATVVELNEELGEA